MPGPIIKHSFWSGAHAVARARGGAFALGRSCRFDGFHDYHIEDLTEFTRGYLFELHCNCVYLPVISIRCYLLCIYVV